MKVWNFIFACLIETLPVPLQVFLPAIAGHAGVVPPGLIPGHENVGKAVSRGHVSVVPRDVSRARYFGR